MKRKIAAALFCLMPLPALRAQDPGELVLTNAVIIDFSRRGPFRGSIVIRGDRIHQIVRGSEFEPSPGSRVLDLGGTHLLPGLIDGHVHISTSRQARRALESGVTTARSMGTGNYADVGLRELIRSGAVQGPEILAAGYHVRPSLPESFFRDNPRMHALMEGVSGPEAFRRVAAANLERGVDFVKVVATDRAGLPDTDPRRPIMSEQELRAVVEEAERRSVPVAAHAHGDEGGRAAVLAGVRSIEHGTYLSGETLRLMKERGTYLVPTVAVVRDLIHPGGDYDNAVLQVRGRHMLPRLRSMVRQAHQLGVRIVAATDTGYGEDSILRIQHEIEELVGCGLSPVEAISAATAGAARLLGIDERTGRIAEGLEADLIAVEGNPLQNIVVLQDVLLVVSDGRVEVNRIAREGEEQ